MSSHTWFSHITVCHLLSLCPYLSFILVAAPPSPSRPFWKKAYFSLFYNSVSRFMLLKCACVLAYSYVVCIRKGRALCHPLSEVRSHARESPGSVCCSLSVVRSVLYVSKKKKVIGEPKKADKNHASPTKFSICQMFSTWHKIYTMFFTYFVLSIYTFSLRERQDLSHLSYGQRICWVICFLTYSCIY